MPYRLDISGMDDLYNKIVNLKDKAPMAAALALYEGAGVIADEVSKGVQGISTAPFKYVKNGEKRKPSPEEKAAVVGAPHGVAKFRKKLHAVDTSVGWNQSGYADVNFSHMSASARTNYKAVNFKGHESNASSFLREVNRHTGGTLGKGAQNQKPVGVIANAINSGTSFMEKQPFIRKAFSRAKSKAIAAMDSKITEELDKLANG